MVYKPTYNWGAPSCKDLYQSFEGISWEIYIYVYIYIINVNPGLINPWTV